MLSKATKKAIIKKAMKDGCGGPGSKSIGAIAQRADLSASDYAALAPLKNSYYKRTKAAGAFTRIAKMTGLGAGLQGKYPKSKQEALDQLSGN